MAVVRRTRSSKHSKRTNASTHRPTANRRTTKKENRFRNSFNSIIIIIIYTHIFFSLSLLVGSCVALEENGRKSKNYGWKIGIACAQYYYYCICPQRSFLWLRHTLTKKRESHFFSLYSLHFCFYCPWDVSHRTIFHRLEQFLRSTKNQLHTLLFAFDERSELNITFYKNISRIHGILHIDQWHNTAVPTHVYLRKKKKKSKETYLQSDEGERSAKRHMRMCVV